MSSAQANQTSSSAAVSHEIFGELVDFEDGDIIFTEGGVSDYAFIVVDGAVELTKSIDGTDIFLTEIGPGDLFGEIGVIDGGRRSATATAVGTISLQRIDQDALVQKLSQDSDFATPVINQLVRNLRATSDRLAHEQVINLQRAAESAEYVAPEPQTVKDKVKAFFDSEVDLIEFQPDAVEIERQKTPAIASVTLYVILFFMFVIGLWASFSSIDTSVSAFGRITTEVPNIVVQPSDTAVIRSILVREGEYVEQGQLLATLDATVAMSNVNVSRTSLVSVAATERRLEAQLAGNAPAGGFSENQAENQLQAELFSQRMTEIQERLSSLDSKIDQIKQQVTANINDIRDMEEQSAVMKEIEGMRSKLMDDGYGSRVNYLSAKYQRLSLDREQRTLESTGKNLKTQMAATQADREAALAEWQAGVSQELVNVRREREKLAEQVVQTEHRESLVRLTAPAPGIVLKIAERSVGSVIQQAQPMFTIVPANVTLEMEVDILPKDVGMIKAGDFVRIKLDALPFQKHGIIEGKVRLISEDAEQPKDGGAQAKSVYRTRIEVGERKLRDVPGTFRLTPGLTGNADITVGKRKIIDYFIYPLVRAMDSSFREP